MAAIRGEAGGAIVQVDQTEVLAYTHGVQLAGLTTIVGSVALACVALGCGCTNRGCDNDIQGRAAIDIQTTNRARVSVTACRNSVCGKAELDAGSTTAPLEFGVRAVADFDGSVDGFAQLAVPSEGRGRWEAVVVLFPDDGAGDFCDGDIVSVTVKDLEDGRVLLEHTEEVVYTEDSPNGEFCGPHCDFAILDIPAV